MTHFAFKKFFSLDILFDPKSQFLNLSYRSKDTYLRTFIDAFLFFSGKKIRNNLKLHGWFNFPFYRIACNY